MGDITDSLFRKKPAFLSCDAIKGILGEDLMKVLTKKPAPTYFYSIDGVAKAIRQKAPNRLQALEAWRAEQNALVEAHNARIKKMIAARAQEYIEEFGKDKDWAFWNAKFEVYRQLAPTLDL